MARAKVGIIGAGRVGATTAFSILQSGIPEELVLIDVDHERAVGEAMDLSHAVPNLSPCDVYAGNYEDLKDAQLVIVTAGNARQPGESRLDLAARNLDIAKNIARDLQNNKESVILVVSNPVDVLTTYFSKTLDPANTGRIIGSGTALDIARLRSIVARKLNVDPRNVHLYIIGEHGDSQVTVWSNAKIAVMDLDGYPKANQPALSPEMKVQISQNVLKAGAEIITRKGSTHFGIAQASSHILQAIMRDQRSISSVSSIPTGECGIEDVALSLPAVLGSNGIVGRLVPRLSEDEKTALHASVEKIRDTCRELGII